MKRKIIVGTMVTMVTALTVLSACGRKDDEKAVSLEPQSLESGNASGETDDGGAADGREPDVGAADGRGTDSAAGAAGNRGTDGATGNAADIAASEQDALGSDTSTGVRAAESLSDTDREIYLQAVNESEGEAKGYSLIYLDGDNIPELVVHDRGNDSYSIYTVKDQALFCMADSLSTVELTYFERCGVIASFSRWNGGGDEGGYGSSYVQVSRDRTLTNDDEAVLSYSYNATYNEEGKYTGTGVTEYFYVGKEIEEAVYREKLAGLGIAEGEDQPCMEGSCDKDEIIALLSRYR